MGRILLDLHPICLHSYLLELTKCDGRIRWHHIFIHRPCLARLTIPVAASSSPVLSLSSTSMITSARTSLVCFSYSRIHRDVFIVISELKLIIKSKKDGNLSTSSFLSAMERLKLDLFFHFLSQRYQNHSNYVLSSSYFLVPHFRPCTFSAHLATMQLKTCHLICAIHPVADPEKIVSGGKSSD
jgi:hypothetical protein